VGENFHLTSPCCFQGAEKCLGLTASVARWLGKGNGFGTPFTFGECVLRLLMPLFQPVVGDEILKRQIHSAFRSYGKVNLQVSLQRARFLAVPKFYLSLLDGWREPTGEGWEILRQHGERVRKYRRWFP